MKNNHVYLSDLHFEHTTWKRELSFQKDELGFLKRRLEEVVPKYTAQEVLGKAEQFQNKLIVHNEVLDTLLHDINGHEHELSSFAEAHPIAVDHVHFGDHVELRERVESQRKIYADYKKDFFRFLTETM